MFTAYVSVLNFLYIAAADMTYLSLTIEGNDVIEVRAGEREAHWIVHVDAFPTANLYW